MGKTSEVCWNHDLESKWWRCLQSLQNKHRDFSYYEICSPKTEWNKRVPIVLNINNTNETLYNFILFW